MDVAVDAWVRYRFSSIRTRQKPQIWCSLTILASGDQCSVKYKRVMTNDD